MIYQYFIKEKEKSIKKSSKNLLLAAGAMSTLGVASFAGVTAVSAQSNDSGQTGMIDAISSKFNLNKDEVKQVFEQQHEEREVERQEMREARLQKLVDNGTITAEQKNVIEAKLAELKNSHESNKDSMKDLTPEQRKAKHDERKTELEDWAKANNLDLAKLKGIFMGRHEGHHRGGPEGERAE